MHHFTLSTLQHEHHCPIYFTQISDAHLLENPQATFAGIQPFINLQAIIKHIQQYAKQSKQPLHCILSTGDIAQEAKLKTYQSYFNEVQKLNLPHFWIRGNHDDNEYFPDQFPKQHIHAIHLGNWSILMMNSQKQGCIYGELSAQQLDSLGHYLDMYPERFIIIAIHHHQFPVGAVWLDHYQLKNSTEFLTQLSHHQHIKAVISGHVHQEFRHQHQGIQFLSCPSVSVQFRPKQDDFNLDDLTAGYRYFTLYPNGQFQSRVLRLKDHLGQIDYSLSGY